MNQRTVLFALLSSCFYSFALAQGNTKGGTVDFSELKPSEVVIPIFSEIVVSPYHAGFVGVYDHTNGPNFIHEEVLKGETVDQWTQMITTTGAQGLSSNANLTPRMFLERIATGFKRACPDTFSAKGMGSATVAGHEAFVAWASCGTVTSAASAHSESTLFVAIKGANDYYTIQWAEHGPASSQPIAYDEAKWKERWEKLSLVKMYPRVPGQAAPNSSGGGPK